MYTCTYMYILHCRLTESWLAVVGSIIWQWLAGYIYTKHLCPKLLIRKVYLSINPLFQSQNKHIPVGWTMAALPLLCISRVLLTIDYSQWSRANCIKPLRSFDQKNWQVCLLSHCGLPIIEQCSVGYWRCIRKFCLNEISFLRLCVIPDNIMHSSTWSDRLQYVHIPKTIHYYPLHHLESLIINN